MVSQSPLKILAPAKINLFLHVVGKKDNGYHDLQSMVMFSDFGDVITISEASEFKFSFDSTSENLPTDGNNLIMCAANLLATSLGKDLKCHIHLTKNIPIGAGLGGGSSDAAATIKGLLKFWDEEIKLENLNDILLSLGADVPSCYHSNPCYFENIGEVIKPIKKIPTLYGVLIYPNQHCSTAEIFQSFNHDYSTKIQTPLSFNTTSEIINFLKLQKNDLTNSAINKILDIKNILNELDTHQNCLLARMSGSGSACFGLFETAKKAHDTAHIIQNKKPNWWIRPVTLS